MARKSWPSLNGKREKALQFQELLGTDRIARLFDMFPVGKLSELSTTSERVWIHCALASFK